MTEQTGQQSAHNPIAAILEATTRYLATVAAMTDDEMRAPSLLPGWSRGHVVAHVGSNAQGMARALRGLRTDTPVPIYDSPEARDAEIEARSGGSAEELAMFSQFASLRLAGELNLMRAFGSVERSPGGQVFSMVELVETRWREVEIHHADLGLAYGPGDWPSDFAGYLLTEAANDRADEVQLTLHAQDIGKTVRVGRGGHGVAGTAGALAWWLVGRGDGSDLVSTRPLPTLGAWTRRTQVK
jgi:maleylpyruvate isomerase